MTKLTRQFFLKSSWIASSFLCAFAVAQPATTPLNKTLAPTEVEDEPLDAFEDTVVVQRKAMKKSDRFLLSTYGTMDFSDGPYSMYAVQVNPGYAISDFWEVYLNFAPYFLNDDRKIVNELRKLNIQIEASKPKMQYGAELLWAPAYGKDSIGSRRVIRSDTFFKIGAMQVKFKKGTGLKFHSGFGKTFFLSNSVGLRAVVSANYMQSVRSAVASGATQGQTKKFRFVAMAEAGFVFYF